MNAALVSHFMSLLYRVAGDDTALLRRVEALSADQRALVAREVLGSAGDWDNDDMGRYLVKESIRQVVRKL